MVPNATIDKLDHWLAFLPFFPSTPRWCFKREIEQAPRGSRHHADFLSNRWKQKQWLNRCDRQEVPGGCWFLPAASEVPISTRGYRTKGFWLKQSASWRPPTSLLLFLAADSFTRSPADALIFLLITRSMPCVRVTGGAQNMGRWWIHCIASQLVVFVWGFSIMKPPAMTRSGHFAGVTNSDISAYFKVVQMLFTTLL